MIIVDRCCPVMSQRLNSFRINQIRQRHKNKSSCHTRMYLLYIRRGTNQIMLICSLQSATYPLDVMSSYYSNVLCSHSSLLFSLQNRIRICDYKAWSLVLSIERVALILININFTIISTIINKCRMRVPTMGNKRVVW